MPSSLSAELVYQSLILMSSLGPGQEMEGAALAVGMSLSDSPGSGGFVGSLGPLRAEPASRDPEPRAESRPPSPSHDTTKSPIERAPTLRALGWDGETVALAPSGGYVQLRLAERALVTQTSRFGNYNFVAAGDSKFAKENASGPEITVQMSPSSGTTGESTVDGSRRYHLRIGGGVTNYRDGQHVPAGEPVVTITSPAYATVTRLSSSARGDVSAGPASRLEIIALLGLSPEAEHAPGMLIRNEAPAGRR